MITPMFLMPAQPAGSSRPDSFLTVNYYLDGQSIGGLTYDMSADKGKQITVKPRCCHYASNQAGLGPAPIETGSISNPLTHPIAGFDGWIGPNDQPYDNLILPATAGWTDATIDAPLVGPKGSFAIDRSNAAAGYCRGGLEILVDGVVKGAIGSYFMTPNKARYSGYTHPVGWTRTGSVLMHTETSITGDFLTMTVEFT